MQNVWNGSNLCWGDLEMTISKPAPNQSEFTATEISNTLSVPLHGLMEELWWSERVYEAAGGAGGRPSDCHGERKCWATDKHKYISSHHSRAETGEESEINSHGRENTRGQNTRGNRPRPSGGCHVDHSQVQPRVSECLWKNVLCKC